MMMRFVNGARQTNLWWCDEDTILCNSWWQSSCVESTMHWYVLVPHQNMICPWAFEYLNLFCHTNHEIACLSNYTRVSLQSLRLNVLFLQYSTTWFVCRIHHNIIFSSWWLRSDFCADFFTARTVCGSHHYAQNATSSETGRRAYVGASLCCLSVASIDARAIDCSHINLNFFWFWDRQQRATPITYLRALQGKWRAKIRIANLPHQRPAIRMTRIQNTVRTKARSKGKGKRESTRRGWDN